MQSMPNRHHETEGYTMISDIHTEEELLREIEQEDEWFESLDVTSLDDFFEETDDDVLLDDLDEEDEDWLH